METFGQQLLQFAQSVDIVSESVLAETRKMITDYLKRSLDIQFWEILSPLKINKENGLKTEWSEGAEWAHSLRDEQGNYNGQISYAWEKQRDIIWIVANSRGENLSETKNYRDLLHLQDSNNIPHYVNLTDHTIKTSIISMLPHDKLNIGIINMESARYLKPSESLKKEIESIRNAIGLLMGLYKTYNIQSFATGRAIDALSEFKNLPFSIDLKAFFSFSKKADASVIDAVNKAIEPYDIELQDWQMDYNPGNIYEQIWTNISNSEIGISYLSELTEPGSEFLFLDNYNVVFETGIMQCLTRLNKMRKYILIRERKSPDIPFNFNAERMIFVPRDEHGKLMRENFMNSLQLTFDSLRIPKK